MANKNKLTDEQRDVKRQRLVHIQEKRAILQGEEDALNQDMKDDEEAQEYAKDSLQDLLDITE